MTQEQKDLLLKDLCARLPYGVKVLCLRDFNHEWYNLTMVDIEDNEVYLTTYEPYANRYVEIEVVKPYLFPFESMTEEQKQQYQSLLIQDAFGTSDNAFTLQDFYNENHLDYRGLIPKGLANDATGLGIY